MNTVKVVIKIKIDTVKVVLKINMNTLTVVLKIKMNTVKVVLKTCETSEVEVQVSHLLKLAAKHCGVKENISAIEDEQISMKHLLSPSPRLSRCPPRRSNWSPSPCPHCPNLRVGSQFGQSNKDSRGQVYG